MSTFCFVYIILNWCFLFCNISILKALLERLDYRFCPECLCGLCVKHLAVSNPAVLRCKTNPSALWSAEFTSVHIYAANFWVQFAFLMEKKGFYTQMKLKGGGYSLSVFMSPPPLSWWWLLVSMLVMIGVFWLAEGGADVRSSSESLLELSSLLEDDELLESEELSPLLIWSITRASAISSVHG